MPNGFFGGHSTPGPPRSPAMAQGVRPLMASAPVDRYSDAKLRAPIMPGGGGGGGGFAAVAGGRTPQLIDLQPLTPRRQQALQQPPQPPQQPQRVNMPPAYQQLHANTYGGPPRVSFPGPADPRGTLSLLLDMPEEEKMRATRAFYDMDRDRSGALDYNEFAEGLSLLRRDAGGAEINRLFREIDFFRSGKITIDEFMVGVSKLHIDLSHVSHHELHSAGSPYEWEIDCQSELEVGDKIGEGSFATVHVGSWRGTTVAVKLLKRSAAGGSVLATSAGGGFGGPPTRSGTRLQREDFQQEIATLGRLRHPNILLYLGACTQPSHMAIVTEFMPDGSLKDLIASRHLSIPEILRIGVQICRGMSYLHLSRPQMIHRDLKPANVLMDRSTLAVKVADFGLATAKGMAGGDFAGTPSYMAPEVLQGEPYDASADVYSFAVVLWEMCTATPPFIGWILPKLINFTVGGQRLAIPPSVPGPIRGLIEACWDQTPQRRPRMQELVRTLERMQRQFGG